MVGKTSRRAMAVRWYFRATRPIAIILAEYFRVCFPEQFRTYEAAFRAGVWEQADPGPFLGRAIVYKLQVKPHLDNLDGEGPAASFPMGSFSGGAMYWPDLKAKLRSVQLFCSTEQIMLISDSYKPGHICIYFAKALYHAVGEWEPKGGVTQENITPGWIGHVFFSHDRSVKDLLGKRENWVSDTAGGMAPSASQVTVGGKPPGSNFVSKMNLDISYVSVSSD
jgi:hypothetical protein